MTTNLYSKVEAIPLSTLPKDTTSKLAGLSLVFTPSLWCWTSRREAVYTNFLSRRGNRTQVYRLLDGRSKGHVP